MSDLMFIKGVKQFHEMESRAFYVKSVANKCL